MDSPVDRVENAARNQPVLDRVRRTAESAKEKDDKFTRVLREKMKDDSRDHQEQKRKRKESEDELLLSIQSEERLEVVEPVQASEEPDQPDGDSSGTSEDDSDRSESIDLTA